MASAALLCATLPLVAAMPASSANSGPIKCELHAHTYIVAKERIPIYGSAGGSGIVGWKYKEQSVRTLWKCTTSAGTRVCIYPCEGVPETLIGRWVRRGDLPA